MTRPEHDLVVFGATGFVGRLVAGYLAEHAPAHLRVALAGRRPGRLTALRHELGSRAARAADWPVLVVDAADEPGLGALAASAGVVLSTVGPYQRHGLPLVRACAREGTDYADLSGEVLFVRDAIHQCHHAAQRSGARIVPSCGFDSVPSDLGVLLLHRQAVADGAGPLTDTTLLVRRLRGGLSGGTVDSARVQLEAVRQRPDLEAVLRDPQALSGGTGSQPPAGVQERDTSSVFREAGSGQWVGPFVMAPHNTRIVRRSNALLHRAYGERFRYRELTAYGSGPAAAARAALVTAALGLGLRAMAFAPARAAVDRLLPAPGEGPDERTRESGCFRVEVGSRTASGRGYLATVAADRDPGYAATAVMLAESGLALAEGEPRGGGGVLTPATALGETLVGRLRSQGFTLDVEPL